MKKIVLLEFKRAADSSESYYQDLWKVTEKQHTPILTGLRALVVDRKWEVEVVPLVVGKRSDKERSGWKRKPRRNLQDLWDRERKWEEDHP